MREFTRLTRILLLTILCVGPSCATGPHVTEPRSNASAHDERSLPASATYNDLIVSMRDFDGLRRKKKGCLLSQRTDGFRFQGQVVSTIGDIPDAPSDLDSYLQRSNRIRLLTAQGYLGPNAKVALAAITSSQLPAYYATAVVLTDQGLYVRSADFDLKDPALRAARRDDDLPLLLANEPRGTTFFVSAEAGVPVARIYAALSAINPVGNAVLAIAVRVASEATSEVDACQALPTDADVSWTAVMNDRVNELHNLLYECIWKVSAENNAGRILTVVAVRQDGSLQGGCIKHDQIRSENLAACLGRLLAPESPRAAGIGEAVRTMHIPLVVRAPRYSYRYDGPAICD